MAIELRQQLKLTPQLIMTPQLQMAIKLLQLSRLELLDTIREEMEENPILEDILDGAGDEESETRPTAKAEDNTPPEEITIEEKIRPDIDWSNYIEEYNAPGRISFEAERKETLSFESFTARKESLKEHLLWQLLIASPSQEKEKIGSLIIGNLTKDGYLDVTVQEIAESGSTSVEKVEAVLALMQTFDPLGICARDLKECLLIQARHFDLDGTIITEIISNHLGHLEKKNYKAITRALKIDMDEVVAAAEIIKAFEPRPGRQFSDEEPQYIQPDIFVYKQGDGFRIMLNDDGLPRLRINPFYRNAMGNNQNIPEKAREYLQDKLNSATWLIKSIHQRQKTIFRVVESILGFQGDFFEKGVEFLKPLVLRDVAQNIGMHESTISRVTTNKYVYTPQGIFELKYFFNSSINRLHGEAIASASVQEKIRQIIEAENHQKPFSDSKIANLLKQENIDIARRTVAKYREMMRILPSSKRKQL